MVKTPTWSMEDHGFESSLVHVFLYFFTMVIFGVSTGLKKLRFHCHI